MADSLARAVIPVPSPSGAAASPLRAAASSFIVAPVYDSIFFILSPLLALGLGILIYYNHLSSMRVEIFGHDGSPAAIFIGAFTMSHLFIVFFRSNGNRKIFDLYPLRFTLVPIVLFTLMGVSRFLAIAMGVLATWWDVYHSSLQTFGLGRIYDLRKGNDAQVGRRLDYFLNLLLYAGPILAGASLVLHTKDFHDFDELGPLQVRLPFIGSLFNVEIGQFGEKIEQHQTILRSIILGVGIPFLLFYLWAYWRYYQQGYKVSVQKVALFAATGFCSIYSWGFNTFGEAFFIMNFFHAFQYWGLVWWSEKKTMVSFFRLERLASGKALALLVFLAIGLGYGLWAEVTDEPLTVVAFGLKGIGLDKADLAFNAIIVVALMHFWYDGFIWSVRKRQV